MDEQQSRQGESLLRHLPAAPDTRHPRGKRHPLGAILVVSVAATLSGARSLYAIAQWGRLQSPEVVRSLGFARDRTPAVYTFHKVFETLDVAAFDAALSAWAREELSEDASQVRKGSAPQVMAALRNSVIGLLRAEGWSNIAAGLRHHAWHPAEALRLLGTTP